MSSEVTVGIVSITYNNYEGLLETVDSVKKLRANNPDFKIKLTVVDGGSTDATPEYLHNSVHVDAYLSEPDSGVFNAMNKGLDINNTDWVCMMNSGDKFSDNFIFDEKFLRSIKNKNVQVIYGDTFYQQTSSIRPINIDLIRVGVMPFCHQSLFLRGHFRYDESLSLYSDFNLICNIFKDKGLVAFSRLNQVVSVYEGNGISSRRTMTKSMDKYSIVFRAFGFRGILASILYSLKFNLFKKS